MSLLSTDITKVRKLSLKEVKLPAPEPRVEPLQDEPVNWDLVAIEEPVLPPVKIPPLQPARGNIKALEDLFIRDKGIANRIEIIKLLDRAKKGDITPEQEIELEYLITGKKEERVDPGYSQVKQTSIFK